MKAAKIFSALAAATILFSAGTNISAEPKPVGLLESVDKSEAIDFVEGIDWTNKVITVTGAGIIPKDAVNYTQAKGMAAKAAQADAYRKLAEIVNGVHVEGETTVEKMLTTQDKIQLRVQATIKGAKVISETFMSDGSYRVVVQMPLFGSSKSLAEAVLEKPAKIDPFPEPVLDVDPSTLPYNSTTPVKRRIEITTQTKVTVEEEVGEPVQHIPAPVKPYQPPLARMAVPFDFQNLQSDVLGASYVQQPVKKTVADYASMAEGNYTGLIVDCRGLDLQPVMSPVIQNANGTKIYGHKNLDIDKVISIGMADYADANGDVGRAGDNPIVVKAVAVKNFNSNPVLSVADSNRVLIENYSTKFLKDLKVVFLFD